MNVLSLVLIVAGVVMIAAGYLRARTPYRRYMELRRQDENIARYEAWRGGPRGDSKTGASVAMQLLRRQAQVGAAVAIAGGVLVFAGFLVR